MVKNALVLKLLFRLAVFWLWLKQLIGKITPNHISGIRLVLMPVVVWLLWQHRPNMLIAALIVLILADITDGLDGYVARKFQKGTDLGKIFDPMCDSVLHLSVFFTLSAVYGLSIWVPLVFFWRDFIVAYFRVMAGIRGRVLGARMSGKYKTFFQIVFQYSFIVFAYVEMTDLIQNLILLKAVWTIFGIAMCLAIGQTLWSFVDYLMHEALNVLTDKRSI